MSSEVSLNPQTISPFSAAKYCQKWVFLALLVMIALGVGMRTRQFLANPSYWYDEAYLLVNVSSKTYSELCGRLQCDQAAPPAYLWCLRSIYLAGGLPESLMRLPSYIASILAIAVLIPLGRLVSGRPGWIWTLALGVFSYHAVTHGVEVKPYTLDLLMSELVMLCTALAVTASDEQRFSRYALMYGIAFFGPWLSYPSVFLLAGSSLALAADAWQRRSRNAWWVWVGMNALLAVSVALVWYLVARHQRTEWLETYWKMAFIDTSSPLSAFRWIIDRLIKAGNYGSTSMGIPLVILGAWGLISLVRGHALPLAAMLIGPMLAAFLANCLHKYPLEDRLLFFAAPCFWVAAGAGVSDIWVRLRSNTAHRILFLIIVAVTLPEIFRSANHLVYIRPKAEFREALAAVGSLKHADDLIWVSHPETAQVYLGKVPDMASLTPISSVCHAAKEKRIWMVVCRGETGKLLEPDLMEGLAKVGVTPRIQQEWRTMTILLCEPPLDTASHP